MRRPSKPLVLGASKEGPIRILEIFVKMMIGENDHDDWPARLTSAKEVLYTTSWKS